MIPVTKPYLPNVKEFDEYINSIWERQWLTNNGPLVNELEIRLKEYLKLDHMLYVSNGTIALQLAIKALGLKGEIITTPFSFIATTSSIVWEGCKPVFVDVEEDTFNIDPAKIEDAITHRTSAILATHVFGNPCKIEAIQQVADKYGLKVIYDAAHCFGTTYNGKSVYEYGDISTTSFHATKLFHTIEGGAVFTKSPEVLKKMVHMRNFGHNGPEDFVEVGINAKNCEFHAAMGLCNLNHVDEILAKRKTLYEHYLKKLANVNARFQKINENTLYNYSYFPIVFETEELMMNCLEELKNEKVFCRRYFYPSLASLPFVRKQKMPVCDSIVNRILCLPLYHTLTVSDLDMIARIMLRVQNYPTQRTVKQDPDVLILEKQIDDLLKAEGFDTETKVPSN